MKKILVASLFLLYNCVPREVAPVFEEDASNDPKIRNGTLVIGVNSGYPVNQFTPEPVVLKVFLDNSFKTTLQNRAVNRVLYSCSYSENVLKMDLAPGVYKYSYEVHQGENMYYKSPEFSINIEAGNCYARLIN